MSVRYRKEQVKLGGQNKDKWFGRAVSMGRVETSDLAEEISHSSTVTRADIMAVLIEMAVAMKKHLQNSMTVSLDGLGDFRVALRTKVADSAKDFKASNIVGYKILFRPETKMVVANGSDKDGKTRRVYVKTMLDGVSAEVLPTNDVVDETASDKGSE